MFFMFDRVRKAEIIEKVKNLEELSNACIDWEDRIKIHKSIDKNYVVYRIFPEYMADRHSELEIVIDATDFSFIYFRRGRGFKMNGVVAMDSLEDYKNEKIYRTKKLVTLLKTPPDIIPHTKVHLYFNTEKPLMKNILCIKTEVINVPSRILTILDSSSGIVSSFRTQGQVIINIFSEKGHHSYNPKDIFVEIWDK